METPTFPGFQRKDVNGNQVVQFNLGAAQIPTSKALRIGRTCAFSCVRPLVTVNSRTSGIPGISCQSDTLTPTVGAYRGGQRHLHLHFSPFRLRRRQPERPPRLGGSTGCLGAGCSTDCVDC